MRVACDDGITVGGVVGWSVGGGLLLLFATWKAGAFCFYHFLLLFQFIGAEVFDVTLERRHEKEQIIDAQN